MADPHTQPNASPLGFTAAHLAPVVGVIIPADADLADVARIAADLQLTIQSDGHRSVLTNTRLPTWRRIGPKRSHHLSMERARP